MEKQGEMGVYFIFGNNRKIYKNTTVFDLYTHTFGNFYGTIFTVCLGNFGIHRRLITEGIGIKRMNRRMRRKLLAFIMLVCLAIGTIVPQAGAEGTIEVPENQAPMQVDDQQLPLPDAAPSVNSATYGTIKLGEISGYQISHGYAMLKKNNSMSSFPTLIPYNYDSLNLENLTIDPSAAYSVELQAYYQAKTSSTDVLVYFDKLDLSGEQLLSMTNWSIDETAVTVTPDTALLSNFTDMSMSFLPEGMSMTEKAVAWFSPSYLTQLKVMMKPGKLSYTFKGKEGNKGYFLKNTIDVQGNTTLQVDEEDIQLTVEVVLPANEAVLITGVSDNFVGISKLYLTPSDYQVGISVEENGFTYDWVTDITAAKPTQLSLSGESRLEFDRMMLWGNAIDAVINIKRGDFLLRDIYRFDGQMLQSVISSKFYIKNEQGERVQEPQNQAMSWSYLNHLNELQLPSGKYELEAVIGIDGQAENYTATKEFIFVGKETGAPRGITISAQDENGQPLQSGQVFLYEKQLPYVEEANNGVTDFYTYLRYQAAASENGKLSIPSQHLTSGKEYDIVVTGRSANGQDSGIYYHQTVTSATSELKLTKDRLKKLTYSASPAAEGDVLHLAVKRNGSGSSTWPIPLTLNKQRKAEIYVSTADRILVYGTVYPTSTDAGYSFTDERAVADAASGTVDLTANLAFVQPPDGFEDAVVSVGDSAPRSSWYVSKGVRDWFYYSVTKGEYRYSFKKYAKIDGNTKFSFDRQFLSYDSYWAHTGQVNLFVYSNFNDEQENYLYDVSKADSQRGTFYHNAAQEPLAAFTVHSLEGETNMIVEKSGDSFVYRQTSLSDGPYQGGGASASAPTLIYQLYDERNQPVGERWYARLGHMEELSVPAIPGTYSMKLEAQLFPDDVAKLDGEIRVHVEDRRASGKLLIPIDIPTGYTYRTPGFNTVEVRTKDAAGNESRLWADIDHSGNFLMYDTDQIAANQEYVILLSLTLSKNGSYEYSTYYNSLRLTGSQLLALTKIGIPNDLAAVSIKQVGVPKEASYLNAQLVAPVEGYSDFAIYAHSFSEMLAVPGDFIFQMTGTNGTNIGFILVNHISVDPVTYRATVTDVPKREVQFKNALPFLSFSSSSDLSLPGLFGGYYAYNTTQLLNKLIVAEGKQWLSVDTLKSSSSGPRWLYSWKTREQLNITKDMTIAFDGKPDPAVSNLSIVSMTRDQDSATQLVIRPELLSGSMRLIEVGENVFESYFYPVWAKIEIKDSSGLTLYAAQSMNWQDDIVIRKLLSDGQYTLIFSLPIGVDEEFKLTKSFTVGDDTVAPTAPTGLRATETDATSVTLAWNPSTDAFGVAGYRIYIGGGQVGTTSGATAYKVTGLTANTPYSFTVKAYDAKGNLSAASQSLTVRTACAGICGGIGGGPMPFNSEDENTVTLTNRDIPAASDGKISIDVKDKTIVVLPARITELVGKNDLEVRFGDAIVSLPPEVLAQLSQLQSTSGLSDASMRLTAVQLNPAEVQGGLASDPSTGVAVFSPIYELKLAVVGKNGEEKLLSSFKTPITVRFPVNPGANRRLTGIYYIADNGKLEYIGGRWEGNELVAELSHFSKYGVFEIKKNFEDVAAKHWALSVIQELAAKQIVNGVTDTKFAPEKKVTRSEFAAMLVKALRLKPAAVSTAFEDVPRNAWYSEAVAAAYAHGLIKGLSNSRFAPQEQITREQMAIMVMNAYQISLKTDSSEVALEFKDSSEISRWAQTSVTEAGSLGLMKGRNGNLFAPKDNASRAEAVQVISNLLQQLSQ